MSSLLPGFDGPWLLGAAARPTDSGHALRGPLPVLRAIHPEDQGGAGCAPAGEGIGRTAPPITAPPPPPRPHSFGQPRAQPHSQAAPLRVTVTLPALQPSQGSRGHSQRGKHRGQRGLRQAAQGRGGF